MVKLVDTIDSKSIVRKDVSVQVRSPVFIYDCNSFQEKELFFYIGRFVPTSVPKSLQNPHSPAVLKCEFSHIKPDTQPVHSLLQPFAAHPSSEPLPAVRHSTYLNLHTADQQSSSVPGLSLFSSSNPACSVSIACSFPSILS